MYHNKHVRHRVPATENRPENVEAESVHVEPKQVHCRLLSQLSPLDMERNLERARLGPAARLGPQPPGVRLEPKIFHRSIIGEIQAKGSSLSVGNYIHEWGCHESDFHKVTQYGSKMCHATVTGVTCDTASRQL